MNADYIALAVAIGAALFAFWRVFRNIIKARLIEDTPTSKVRSASQGYVELSGFARAAEDNPVIAPLTGRPCLWYYYKIERYERSSKSSSWRTLESEASFQYFNLEDDTGECAIDPRRTDVQTRWNKTWRGNTRRPTASTGSKPSLLGNVLGGNYRYTENIIRDNDYLYVLGMFQSVHAPSSAQQQKDKTRDLLNEWKRDYDALVARFDSNADGELDMQEWEVARQEAARQAHHYVLDNYDDSPVNIMARPPERRKPYIISNHDPKQLTRQYRWKAAGMAAVFLLSTSIAVFLCTRLWPVTGS